MKNKKIYRVITFVVILSVLLSFVCISASAYQYRPSAAGDAYYMPDTVQVQKTIIEDFTFKYTLRDYLTEGYFSYSTDSNWETSSRSKEFVGGIYTYLEPGRVQIREDHGTGREYTLYSSLIPRFDLFDFADSHNPILITFPITVAACLSYLENISFSAGYKEIENLEYVNIDSFTNVNEFFSFDDLVSLIEVGYGFDGDQPPESKYSYYTVYVEVLCDPLTKTCYLTFFDGKGNSFSRSCSFPDSGEMLCFILSVSDSVESGDFGHIYIGRTPHYTDPPFISMYELKSVDRFTDVIPDNYNDEILLDGSNYDGMTGNYFNGHGYNAAYDPSGSTDAYLPIRKDGYYEFIKNSDTYYTQAQLWFPYQEQGLQDFNSVNNSIARLSFDISAIPRDFLEFKFVEARAGDRWGEEWCILDSFLKIVPVSYSAIEGAAGFEIQGWDCVLKTYTAYITDPYANWFNISIDIRLDSSTDSIYLDYYIDNEYIASGTRELTTYYDSISSIYMSLQTSIEGTGMKFDNFSFVYADYGVDYDMQYSEYVKPFLNKISSNEKLHYADEFVSIGNSYFEALVSNNQLKNENDILTETVDKLNAELSIQAPLIEELRDTVGKLKMDLMAKETVNVLDELFSGTWGATNEFVDTILGLGIDYDGNGVNDVTIGTLCTILLISFVIVKILPMLIGGFRI